MMTGYGQMAIEHQRRPIGHKGYGVANWPQLDSRLELPQHPWRRVNLCGCDTMAAIRRLFKDPNPWPCRSWVGSSIQDYSKCHSQRYYIISISCQASR
ncbi:hypothetical protein O181_105647 [Austropuccinia psidii MF-1]|uniref:Uncharacterized protein n=1 Tax=Austropuccinia psidii MF-1 TaxID=1389203 RepID=A0A9Q3JNX0_9BASI|nr:hypothetical protein [Austropuccinia psidii MF-1]